MENRAYALAVGLFTLLMGGAVVLCLWWFSGNAQESRNYLIVSQRGVSGLNPQAAVRYRGVRVGKVVDVELQDSREVFIEIRIDADIPVTRATRARIGIQGLTGQGFVILDDDGQDGAEPPRMPGRDLPLIAMQSAESPAGPAEGAQDLMQRLRRTSERIDRVLSDENIARLNDTFKNLAASSANLDRTLAQSAALTEDLRRFATPENAARLSQTLEQAHAMSSQLAPAVQEFRGAVARVNAAAGRIDRLGEGVQTQLEGDALPRATTLLGELESSSRQLSRVLDELERSPQMLLGGKQAQVPGPGEVRP